MIKLTKKLLATLTLVIPLTLVILWILLPVQVLANPGLEVTAPSVVTLTTLYGLSSVDATVASGGTGGTVLSTDGGYTLRITSSDPDGRMSKDGLGVTDLAAALKVTAALVQGDGAPITTGSSVIGVAVTSGTLLTVGGTLASAPGANNINLSVAQPRQTTGTPGTYSYILTWTVSAN